MAEAIADRLIAYFLPHSYINGAIIDSLVALSGKGGTVSPMKVTPPYGLLQFSGPDNKAQLSRASKTGRAIRLTTGVYAVGASLPPADVAHHHRFDLIAHYWPDGVICASSALVGGGTVDGVLYVAAPDGRQAPLVLPGMSIQPIPGPGPLPGDIDMPAGTHMSGPARALTENVTGGPGRPARHRSGLSAVEDRIDMYARSSGAGRIRSLLDQLDVIAGSFDPGAVEIVRVRLAATLDTFTGATPQVSSPLLAARIAGAPFDGHRIIMLEQLIEVLTTRPPTPRPVTAPIQRWAWLPFFEAYFSNFIEGTQFSVDDARTIAIDGIPFFGKLEDSHDIAATYRLAADSADRVLVPTTGAELVEILQHRHRVLMAARPDKHPGELKERRNYAGGYEFVAPELVAGTLERGFATLRQLHDPLARAVSMMALVTECHPFDDGNGRVARLTANAELSAAGEVRIVIPTVYRSNYLAGLGALSNGTGKGDPLVAVLEFAQRWTGAVDWSDYTATNAILMSCNAFDDAIQAEATGRRLRMPN